MVGNLLADAITAVFVAVRGRRFIREVHEHHRKIAELHEHHLGSERS